VEEQGDLSDCDLRGFSSLCRSAYNMVLHKYGEKLYDGLQSTMTWRLKEISIDRVRTGWFVFGGAECKVVGSQQGAADDSRYSNVHG
jgi:hypothetical protein